MFQGSCSNTLKKPTAKSKQIAKLNFEMNSKVQNGIACLVCVRTAMPNEARHCHGSNPRQHTPHKSLFEITDGLCKVQDLTTRKPKAVSTTITIKQIQNNATATNGALSLPFFLPSFLSVESGPSHAGTFQFAALRHSSHVFYSCSSNGGSPFKVIRCCTCCQVVHDGSGRCMTQLLLRFRLFFEFNKSGNH